jgi:hypothetical protein
MLEHVRALRLTCLASLLIGLLGGTLPNTALAQNSPKIVAVPSSSHPPAPADLKVACLVSATNLKATPTCVVIKYKGITTWAYSFIDNRVSFALVSYDAKGNVLRNVTYDGARYVWQMVSNPYDQTVTVLGQAGVNAPALSISAPWSKLGP